MPVGLQFNLSATNQSQQITGSYTQFTNARFIGIKGFSSGGFPVYNTANVYLGIASGKHAFTVSGNTAGAFVYDVPRVDFDTFSNWWAFGNSGDGLYIFY